MKTTILYSALVTIPLISCIKSTPTPIKIKTVCGTEGRPQGTWEVKFVVTGSTIPDSVNFNVNLGQAQFGTVYYKTFIQPSLTLSDSAIFCGDTDSDIIARVYSHDTTQQFTTKIFVDDSLVIQKTGFGNTGAVGQFQ